MTADRSRSTTQALCSSDLIAEDLESVELLATNQAPRDISRALALAWSWYEKNWFVLTLVELKIAFANHGLRLTDPAGRPVAWEPWFAGWAESVWRDRFVYDNVVTIWIEDPPVAPTTFDPARCLYSDALGLEKLRCESPWRMKELPAGLKRRWSAGYVELDPAQGEHFRVLKRARVGAGFGRPGLYRMFRGLSQAESMEVADSLNAFVSRTVIRQHKLGHDPKSSAFKSKVPHYYTKARADAIKEQFGNSTGFMETVTNFDHGIEFPHVDPEVFDGDKYDGVVKRLLWWGGPLAQMLASGATNPYLMPILRQELQAERDRVGRYLQAVLREHSRLEVTVNWSNRCFLDPRTATELLMAGLTGGPLSQASFLEEAGFSPEDEKERKAREAAEDPKLHLPLYDKDHGQEPGNTGGRPAGKRDPVGA